MYGIQLEEGEMQYSTAHSSRTADIIVRHWSQASTKLLRNWMTWLAGSGIDS